MSWVDVFTARVRDVGCVAVLLALNSRTVVLYSGVNYVRLVAVMFARIVRQLCMLGVRDSYGAVVWRWRFLRRDAFHRVGY